MELCVQLLVCSGCAFHREPVLDDCPSTPSKFGPALCIRRQRDNLLGGVLRVVDAVKADGVTVGSRERGDVRDETRGAQRQFYLLSTALADRFDVHFVVGDYGQPQVTEHEGVTLHRAYRPDPGAGVRDRVQQLGALGRALARADADVYLARCLPRKLAVLYPLVAMRRRPLVYHVATDEFVERPPSDVGPFRARLYARALRRCRLVAQTPYQADLLRREWGLKARVIPNGYSPATVVDRHRNRETFLWVGRLAREKRPHLFLDLAERFPDEQFILVGPSEDDVYATDIRTRAETMDNVTATGRVPPSAVHEHYRRAIALVNTSELDREGFPNTFLEAWRYATPVLGLDIDPGRFLESDGTGHAGGEFDRLVTLTRRLADETDKRRRLGAGGMRAFRQHYHLNSTVKLYVDVLREALE